MASDRWKKLLEKGSDLASKGGQFVKDGIDSGKEELHHRFNDEGYQQGLDEGKEQGLKEGLSKTIQCLLEVDAADTDMVRVLGQFWDLSEADAKGYLAQEKSNAAIRALSHYLKAEMAWPNAEIEDFLAAHHVRDQLEDNPKLWKYEKNPAKLYKMLQG